MLACNYTINKEPNGWGKLIERFPSWVTATVINKLIFNGVLFSFTLAYACVRDRERESKWEWERDSDVRCGITPNQLDVKSNKFKLSEKKIKFNSYSYNSKQSDNAGILVEYHYDGSNHLAFTSNEQNWLNVTMWSGKEIMKCLKICTNLTEIHIVVGAIFRYLTERIKS